MLERNCWRDGIQVPATGAARAPTVYSLAHPGVPAGLSDSEALRLNAKFLRNGIVMLVLVAGTVALLYTGSSRRRPPGRIGSVLGAFYDDGRGRQRTEVRPGRGDPPGDRRPDGKTYVVVVAQLPHR